MDDAREAIKSKNLIGDKVKLKNNKKRRGNRNDDVIQQQDEPPSLFIADDEEDEKINTTNTRRENNQHRCHHHNATHGLLIRITDSTILKEVAALKRAIKSTHPDISPFFVTITTLHIPLVVMTLNNQTDIQKVYNALKISLVEITKLISSIASNITIELESLDNFQDKVVFLTIKQNEGLDYLKKMKKILNNSLSNVNIDVKHQQFTWGVDIMNLNNCFRLMNKKHIKDIRIDVYKVYKHEYFGKQDLADILLCPLNRRGIRRYDFNNILVSMNLMEAKLHLSNGEMIEVCIPHEMVRKNGTEEVRKKVKSKRLHKDYKNDSSTKNSASKYISNHRYSHPTHFLAIRLHNRDIHKKVTELHEIIVNINKDFKPSFVDLHTLHITLAVMALNDEEISRAIKAIELSIKRLNDVYTKSLCKFIELDTLGSFKGEVVFINVKNTEGLELLQSIFLILKDSLHAQNIVIQRETFTPHVTLMKLSKSCSFQKNGIKKIPTELYDELKNDYFGNEEIIEILLCSMDDIKENDFYNILACVNLKNNDLNQLDKKREHVEKEGDKLKGHNEEEPK